MAKESLDDLRHRLKERLNDLRAIGRLVQSDEAFAAAYEAATQKEAKAIADAIDGARRDEVQEFVRKGKRRSRTLDELTVVELRDTARTMYHVRDKDIRAAQEMNGKAGLVRLVEKAMEEADRGR